MLSSRDMSWIVAIVICVTLAGFSRIIQRSMLKESGMYPVAFSVVSAIFCTAIVAGIGLFNGDLKEFSWSQLNGLGPYIFSLGLLYGIGNIFNYNSLVYTEASIFTIIFASRMFFGILASAFFLGEKMTVTGIIGAVIIAGAIILANLNGKKLQLGKGEWLALGGALFFGLGNINDRFLLRELNPTIELLIANMTAGVFMVLVSHRQMKASFTFFTMKTIRKIAGYSVFYAIASYLFVYAMQVADNAAKVITIGVASTIITVIMSVVLLKERNHLWRKLIAAGIAVIGALLVV